MSSPRETDAIRRMEKLTIEDIREPDESTQDELLEFAWHCPLSIPDCNTSGIDCAVVVLRRMFRDLSTDNRIRATSGGEQDTTKYKSGKVEARRTFGLFQYSWHHLPDLGENYGNMSMEIRVMSRQSGLLRRVIFDHHMAPARYSFSALMESKGMVEAFWGRAEMQPYQSLSVWQEPDEVTWWAREQPPYLKPFDWKLDKEPSIEAAINNRFAPVGIDGGKTSMLLPNWPKFLRVHVTGAAASVPVDAVLEQRLLTLNGCHQVDGSEVDGEQRLVQTQRQYRLSAAVVLRPSEKENDLVYTFDSAGEMISPSVKRQIPYKGMGFSSVMVNEAMLYYSRVDSDESSESPLSDDQEFRRKFMDLQLDTSASVSDHVAHLGLPTGLAHSLRLANENFLKGTGVLDDDQ
ncbi:hypothetical protein Daus18300_013820 [Diaporthe australafricana]|uniref:HNH nuclease domain-containing protein n=1 Tax=Diaporthe australafricana TaxID=127596 RepID=A0ABR3VXP5_9PEZI